MWLYIIIHSEWSIFSNIAALFLLKWVSFHTFSIETYRKHLVFTRQCSKYVVNSLDKGCIRFCTPMSEGLQEGCLWWQVAFWGHRPGGAAWHRGQPNCNPNATGVQNLIHPNLGVFSLILSCLHNIAKYISVLWLYFYALATIYLGLKCRTFSRWHEALTHNNQS